MGFLNHHSNSKQGLSEALIQTVWASLKPYGSAKEESTEQEQISYNELKLVVLCAFDIWLPKTMLKDSTAENPDDQQQECFKFDSKQDFDRLHQIVKVFRDNRA